MKLYRELRRYWLHRQGMRIAVELAAANCEYQTRVAIHGREAFIYAEELAKMAGKVEALITKLDFINAKREALKPRGLIPLPVIDGSLLGEGK